MIALDVNCELWRFCKRPDPPCWCKRCRLLAAPFWVDGVGGDAWVAASDGWVLVMQREDARARDQVEAYEVAKISREFERAVQELGLDSRSNDPRVVALRNNAQRQVEEILRRRRVHTLPAGYETVVWALLSRDPALPVVTGCRDALCRWLEDIASPVLKRDRIGCPTERRCQVDREPAYVRMLGVVVNAGRLCEVLDNAPNGRVRFRSTTWRGLPCLDVCSTDWAARVMCCKHDDPESVPSWPEAVPHAP